jgi:short-chain Z-isoprenyl diphosphate synthase
VLSADNIRKRSGPEIDYLFHLLETVVPRQVADSDSWRLHVSGNVDLLPDAPRTALRQAVADTASRPGHLTLAVGYDPHQDILGAIRGALREPSAAGSSEQLVATISERLTGGPVKDIDLVIRTSGEHRISGFFPWQSQGAEIYVSDKLWPAFTEEDLDAALAYYAFRQSRP